MFGGFLEGGFELWPGVGFVGVEVGRDGGCDSDEVGVGPLFVGPDGHDVEGGNADHAAFPVAFAEGRVGREGLECGYGSGDEGAGVDGGEGGDALLGILMGFGGGGVGRAGVDDEAPGGERRCGERAVAEEIAQADVIDGVAGGEFDLAGFGGGEGAMVKCFCRAMSWSWRWVISATWRGGSANVTGIGCSLFRLW